MAIPEQTRLDEDKQFTNGMMNELLTVCKSMDNNLFFELLKSILPLSVVNNPQFSMDYKHFSGSKLKIFHKSLKKVKKNTSKLVEFYTNEFVFVTRDSDTPRKKTLKRRIRELAEENEQLNQSSSLEDELLSLQLELREKEDKMI